MTPLLADTTPRVSVNGTDLSNAALAALRYIRVEKSLCLVGRATLRFHDVGYQIAESNGFPLGATVEIKSGSATLFEGTVTGASLEHSGGGHPDLVITADDVAHKLSLGAKAKTFVNMTFTDIVTKVVKDAGLSAPSVTLDSGGTEVHDYLLQSGPDLAFIDTIARRCGSVWWVDGKTFTVEPARATTGSATATLATDLIDFSVRTSGLRPTRVTVKGWDASAQQDVTADSSSGASATASSDFVADYVKGTTSIGAAVQNVGDANPNTHAEAAAVASASELAWQAGAVVARGTGFVNAGITLMCALTVNNAGPASGTYTVSEVEHIYREDGFYTRFVAGPVRPAKLVDTLAPDTASHGFAIDGLVTGTVTNNKDPDNVGRVKVKYAGTGDVEGPWARVVSLGGGGSRGVVFHPEVGDEVLVGFERGDTRHPVVIGGLNSSKKALAADTKLVAGSGDVTYRRITSRLGHVIELGDGSEDTEQYILLQLGTGAKHKLRLGADRFDIEVANGKPLLIKAGTAKFEITSAGDVTIAGKNVKITAQQNLQLEGGLKAEMKGVETSVEGSAKIDVKGGLGNVQASGPLALKGATVAIN